MEVGTRVRVSRQDTVFAGEVGTVVRVLVSEVRDFEVLLDREWGRYCFETWELEEI